MTASEAARNAREKAMWLIREHAMARQHDVADGLMTPRLAALMAQRYAMGVLDTFTALYGDRAAGPLGHAVNAEVYAIDPDWQLHASQRWAQRPADLAPTAG